MPDKIVKISFSDAPQYEAAKHFGVATFRLQHKDLSGVRGFWVGLSYFLPNGGAEMESSSAERVYVVISGTVTVTSEDGQEYVLGPMDSIYIPPGVRRSILNKGKEPAAMLVIVSPNQGQSQGQGAGAGQGSR
ncbi:MAG: cupin domain-containing protein [Conexivisphaera sp.]